MLGVDERCWGLDTARKHARTRSFIHSVSKPAKHSVSQTKRSSILQEDSRLPGDGASYPCIALGGAEEVGAPGLGGFVLAAEIPSAHTHTCIHAYISIFSSPGYSSHYHTSIDLCSVLEICFFFFFNVGHQSFPICGLKDGH